MTFEAPEWLLQLFALIADGSLWLALGAGMVVVLVAAYGVVLLLRLLAGRAPSGPESIEHDVDSAVLAGLTGPLVVVDPTRPERPLAPPPPPPLR